VTNTEDQNLIICTAKIGQNKPYNIKMIFTTNKLKIKSSSGVQNIKVKEIKKLIFTTSMVINTHSISTFPVYKERTLTQKTRNAAKFYQYKEQMKCFTCLKRSVSSSFNVPEKLLLSKYVGRLHWQYAAL
jgi:hypothetical protein